MDTVLISVTLVSLGLAGSMSVLVARMLRDERKRSDARVSALLELAAQTDASQPVAAAPAAGTRVASDRPPARTGGASARHELRVDELELRLASTAAVAGMFAEPERSSPWSRRLAVIGVLAGIGGILFMFMSAWRGPAGTARDVTEQRVTRAAAAPLELVALRHTQDAETLTIAGLVQNPKTGATLTRIAVTAVVFGPDGTLLASGQAPLDYTSVAAGDESPFVVTVPVKGAVARYRVGFRSEDGGVVAHIDRRAGDVSRAGM